MEQQCAKAIWERSVEKHGLRYTTMLSGGDSKSYSLLVESKVYGNDIVIEKEECVNHVSKRMGTALNNLKCRVQGQSIIGKGKLTNQMITKIQNYYGRAIKDHSGDVSLMKKRIFAILFHLTSTDKEPKHTHCQPGERSWCFWQRALSKNENPGAHKEHETLPVDVVPILKLVPIFQRLTNENLLDRCKRNRTQNPNESIHNVIWRFYPKITYVGRKSIESATCMAICQFSIGATFWETLCRTLGVEPGSALIEKSILKTVNCIKKAERAASKEAKGRRKRLKFVTVSNDKKKTNKEGQTYKAGAFC